MLLLRKIILIAALLYGAVAQAVLITVDDEGIDAIFSQPSFGNNPIDIRVLPTYQIVRPDLLDISTSDALYTLFDMGIGSYNQVNMFFVENISWCGTTGFYAGCGMRPGNNSMVEYAYLDSSYFAELLSHEIGHNLGLPHGEDWNSLMYAGLNGGTYLSPDEVNAIRSSPLLQADAEGWFIELIPIMVVSRAIAVSEANSLALMCAGLLVFAFRRTQRTKPLPAKLLP